MSNFLNLLIALVIAAVTYGTPLLFGTLGEVLTEKSGNLNLGVEGIMFMGGALGLGGVFYYEKAAGSGANGFLAVGIGILCAFLAGAFASLIFSFLTTTLRANQNVTGLALSIFGTGIGQFIGEHMRVTEGGYISISNRLAGCFQNSPFPAFLRNIPREEVAAAAKTAQAWDFIQALPEGLDSRLDIRGANLSGGQRQRLLIARALAARPGTLILDSADSALDYRTAAALHAAIRRDFPGVTLVVISERVASLREADRILVLEEGAISAQGTHRQLLETCRRYRRMAELQMGGLE